jgi:hypothetical protein
VSKTADAASSETKFAKAPLCTIVANTTASLNHQLSTLKGGGDGDVSSSLSLPLLLLVLLLVVAAAVLSPESRGGGAARLARYRCVMSTHCAETPGATGAAW